MDVTVDLTVDRNQLDSHFEGYKLSLDPLPVHNRMLEAGGEKVPLSEEQYSMQHIKAFGIRSGLYGDVAEQNKVYFIDENWEIIYLEVKDDAVGNPRSLMKIPGVDKRAQCPERVTPSLTFASENHAMVADGVGNLHIISIAKTQSDITWKIEHSCQPVSKNTPFAVVTATEYMEEDTLKLSVVLVYIIKEEDEKSKSPFKTLLEWLTFGKVDSTWQQHRIRRLEGHACPDYVSLERKDEAILLATEKPLLFVYDSLKPVEKEEEEGWEVEEVQVEEPVYTWTQNEGEISVYFPLDADTCKDNIKVNFKPKSLSVEVKGEARLSGELQHEVQTNECTWIINDDKKLQIVLHKCSPDTVWSSLVPEDNQGREDMDPDRMAAINDQLAAYTTDGSGEPAEKKKKAYNSQQLEECDMFTADSAVLLRIDGDTHKLTHKVNVGSHQWLFNSQPMVDQPAGLCLRHDVDGIMWKPEPAPVSGKSPWRHTATFNAFGYVVASKEQRKFCSCAPDYSYVAVSDAHRHVYIYRQPSDVNSPVRNRKTGQQITAVAKQQLISLESTEEISGMVVSNEWVFLLVSTTLYAVKTKSS